jgi:hypothetical protein
MTRRRLLCGLLLASVVLTCLAYWLWLPRKMTRGAFEQVKKGMTKEEVIQTVGGLENPNPHGPRMKVPGSVMTLF